MSVTAIANPVDLLRKQYGADIVGQPTADAVPTLWSPKQRIREVLAYLKNGIEMPYKLLYDLTATDDRMRMHRHGQASPDFTVIYHLFSFERNEYIRIKTALRSDALSMESITDLWPAANW